MHAPIRSEALQSCLDKAIEWGFDKAILDSYEKDIAAGDISETDLIDLVNTKMAAREMGLPPLRFHIDYAPGVLLIEGALKVAVFVPLDKANVAESPEGLVVPPGILTYVTPLGSCSIVWTGVALVDPDMERILWAKDDDARKEWVNLFS